MRVHLMNAPTSVGSSPGTAARSATSPGSDRLELSVQQADLAFGVGKAFASVSSRSPLPLLGCLLLEADGKTLKITGTDLDVTTVVSVPCTVKKAGKVTLKITPRGKTKSKLARGGSARVTAKITYSPTGGTPSTKKVTLKLKA